MVMTNSPTPTAGTPPAVDALRDSDAAAKIVEARPLTADTDDDDPILAAIYNNMSPGS